MSSGEDMGEITKKMEKLGKKKDTDDKIKKGSSSSDIKGISTQSTPDVRVVVVLMRCRLSLIIYVRAGTDN